MTTRVLMALTILLLLASRSHGLTVPVDGATYSADTTFQPGTYSLPNGVNIGADNVTLDCNGATLVGSYTSGSSATYGIQIFGSSHVTVKNCTVSGYYYAVRVDLRPDGSGSTDVHVLDNVLSNNGPNNAASRTINVQPSSLGADTTNLGGGLYMRGVSRADVEGNTLQHGNNGIDLFDVTASLIRSNDARYHLGWGIHLYQSSGNTIQGNSADYCTGSGGDSAGILLVWQSNGNAVVGNSLTHSGDGFFIGNEDGRASNDNVIQGNNGSYAGANAFEATFSEGNMFLDNDASYSGAVGFWLGYSSSTLVRGNRIVKNGWNGLEVQYGVSDLPQDYNVIEDNVFLRNGHSAIALDSGTVCPALLQCLDIAPPSHSKGYSVSGNAMLYNGAYGVELDNTMDTTIVDNALYGNGCGNAYVTHSPATCDPTVTWSVSPTAGGNLMGGTTLGGNFWGDYTGADTNGDGLGDTPYANGTGPTVDSHPIRSTSSALCGPLAPLVCGGDCNVDGTVTSTEVQQVESIDLGTAQQSTCANGVTTELPTCTAADADGDGTVTYNDVTTALNYSANGCNSCSAAGCPCVDHIVHAPEPAILEVGHVTACGAGVDVPIVLAGDGGIIVGTQLDILYPTALLSNPTCTTSTGDEAGPSFPGTPPAPAGTTRMRVIVQNGQGPLPSGTIATCHFDVNGSPAPGRYRLIVENPASSTSEGGVVPTTTAGGAVHIPLPGCACNAAPKTSCN